MGGDHVDSEAQGRPPADDDREDAEPNSDDGDDDESWRADGANNIRPHPRAVQQAHEGLRTDQGTISISSLFAI